MIFILVVDESLSKIQHIVILKLLTGVFYWKFLFLLNAYNIPFLFCLLFYFWIS